jgi:hypothetical protein
MFHKNAPIMYADEALPPVFALDEAIENYFDRQLKFKDLRTERNNPEYFGQISIHADANKLDEENFFTLLTDPHRDLYFKLIERIYTAQNVTVEQLEEDIRTDPEFSVVYIQESLRLGWNIVGTEVPDGHPGPTEVVDFIEFELNFPEVHEKFKLWINRQKFATDYPLSTIAQVVLPCDHSILLNPSTVPTTIDAIIASTSFSFSDVENKIHTGDHSGLMTYTTRYIVSSTSIKRMPFGILYKGAQPSSLEIRKAIREKLLGYGTAPEEEWKKILPDLFVTGQFFILPFWDNMIQREDRRIFQSILPTKRITGLISQIYPALEEVFIEKYQQLLTYAQNPGFGLVIPDPLNEVFFSLQEIHPTYQHYSTQNNLHTFMETHTKEFSIRLNRCLAVLLGESINEEFILNTFDGIRYMSFVTSGIEYHVIHPEDYPKE